MEIKSTSGLILGVEILWLKNATPYMITDFPTTLSGYIANYQWNFPHVLAVSTISKTRV